jgi:hypothetical protein
MRYVAIHTFTDPDGGLIEAGKTFVSGDAEVFRTHPHAFKRAAGRRSGYFHRDGGELEVIRSSQRLLPPKRESWRL